RNSDKTMDGGKVETSGARLRLNSLSNHVNHPPIPNHKRIATMGKINLIHRDRGVPLHVCCAPGTSTGIDIVSMPGKKQVWFQNAGDDAQDGERHRLSYCITATYGNSEQKSGVSNP